MTLGMNRLAHDAAYNLIEALGPSSPDSAVDPAANELIKALGGSVAVAKDLKPPAIALYVAALIVMNVPPST